MTTQESEVDVLARALFEAYSRNGGNPPDAHCDRNAAEQWMAQALAECGVAELIEAAKDLSKGVEFRIDDPRCAQHDRLRTALRNAGVKV